MGKYRVVLSLSVLFTVVSVLLILRIKEYKYDSMIKTICKTYHSHNLRNGKEELGNLIPRNEIIDEMGNDDRDDLYWVYVNSLQVFCKNQMRFGSLTDSGKYLCLDKPYKPEGKCLVYSFGSNFQFDFEEAVYRHFNCEIHTFDPSKPIKKHKVPGEIRFHFIGLGAENKLNKKGWNLKTLQTLQTTLNHKERIIDIMKIDIEYGEWKALPEILESGSLHNVKQLSIEVHYKTKDSKKLLKTLRLLYEAGFHIFMHELNPVGDKMIRYPYNLMTTINELSMVNVNWSSSRNN